MSLHPMPHSYRVLCEYWPKKGNFRVNYDSHQKCVKFSHVFRALCENWLKKGSLYRKGVYFLHLFYSGKGKKGGKGKTLLRFSKKEK